MFARNRTNLKSVEAEASEPDAGFAGAAPLGLRVKESDASLRGLSSDDFSYGDRPAALALAYVSPHVDFAQVTARLKTMAGATRVVAVSTAGELCSMGADRYTGRPATAGPA